jgi:hypothetical protein
VQPVAAVVDVASAAFIRLISWRDVVEAPSAADPGSRRVVADGGTVLVMDADADHVIELTAISARARPRSIWAGYDLEGARRFSAAWRSGRQTAALDGPGQRTRRFAIVPTPGTERLEARTSMEITESGEPTQVPLGVGRVTAGLAVGGAGWVCVRRAPLRPWTWRPPASLLRVEAKEAVDVLPTLDITELSWPRPDSAELDKAAERRFEQLRRWASAQPAHLTDVGVEIEAVELNAAGVDSTVNIVFTAPVRPGLKLVRTIELFDEVGAPLDDPTSLHEDVLSNFLPPASAARDGVLHV